MVSQHPKRESNDQLEDGMSRDPMKPFDERTIPNQTTNSSLDNVKETISDVASRAKDKANQMADAVSERLSQQRETAAEGLGRVASTMHEKADSVPGGPKVVNFTHSIADGMESTATYLRDHDFSKMGKDLMNVCRKYPTQSVLAALAVGFLLGRSARR
jgi:methyl-accepting chemotaxis protein